MDMFFGKSSSSRKKAFSLPEVLISFVLLSLLVSSLLSSGKTLSHFLKNKELEQKEEKALAFSILDQCFTRLQDTSETCADPIFFTPNLEELFFSFDNGIQKIPELSSQVIAHLYCRDSSLELALWPKSKQKTPESYQIIPLFSGIERLAFSFYHPNNNQWLKSWKKEENSFPLMLKLHLEKTDGTSEIFPFLIPGQPLSQREP